MKILSVTLLSVLGLALAQYDYKEVLHKSILFYEAERSGRLVNNRIPWRGDSFVNDAEGVDLSGGYFDAGDHVKFGLPMSAAMTVLAWSIMDYKDAYENAGELAAARDAVRWGADWLLKASKPEQDVVYAQVGNGDVDHAYWGRPEDFPSSSWRPVYRLTSGQPGSDLAAGYSAALAAAYMALKDVDLAYANICLDKAKALYWWANNHRGIYSDVVTDANTYYKSWGYGDELGYAAVWIALATNEQTFRDEAWNKWSEFNLGGQTEFFDWGEKKPGVAILMWRVFQYPDFKTAANENCRYWVYSSRKTPKGLVYINDWASLRHAANAAFGCLQVAEYVDNSDAYNYRNFAKKQIHYALGDTGRSYVVGYGNNPPVRCHHRAASCPDPPNGCSYDGNFWTSNPNPHVLEGALVGGPDVNDNYSDTRDNYQQNEVTLDYNAGFQAAVAGLLHLQLTGQLP